MKKIIVTGALVLSSVIGLAIASQTANASPLCYGVDSSGASMDLSQLCGSSSSGNPLPSTPSGATQGDKLPPNQPTSPVSEQPPKDLQNCLNSPTCRRVVDSSAGQNQPEATPHQGRMDRLMEGGAIKRF